MEHLKKDRFVLDIGRTQDGVWIVDVADSKGQSYHTAGYEYDRGELSLTRTLRSVVDWVAFRKAQEVSEPIYEWRIAIDNLTSGWCLTEDGARKAFGNISEPFVLERREVTEPEVVS